MVGASFEGPARHRSAAAVTFDVDAESGVLSETPEAAVRRGGCFVPAVRHPYLSGRRGRVVALGRLLRHVLSTAGFLSTTLQGVAEHVASLRLEAVRHRLWDGAEFEGREG